MVKHTKEFIEKHERLIQKRENEKLEKKLKREELRKANYEKKKAKNREKYRQMRENNPEEYAQYISTMMKYRIIYKERKKNELLERFKGYAIYYNDDGSIRYFVNADGDVYTKNGRFIKGSKHPLGYVSICGKMKHRIVWEAFNGKILNGYEVDHINTIRDDNRLENLRVCTHRENCNNPLSIENYARHNKSVDRSYLRKHRDNYIENRIADDE